MVPSDWTELLGSAARRRARDEWRRAAARGAADLRARLAALADPQTPRLVRLIGAQGIAQGLAVEDVPALDEWAEGLQPEHAGDVLGDLIRGIRVAGTGETRARACAGVGRQAVRLGQENDLLDLSLALCIPETCAESNRDAARYVLADLFDRLQSAEGIEDSTRAYHLNRLLLVWFSCLGGASEEDMRAFVRASQEVRVLPSAFQALPHIWPHRRNDARAVLRAHLERLDRRALDEWGKADFSDGLAKFAAIDPEGVARIVFDLLETRPLGEVDPNWPANIDMAEFENFRLGLFSPEFVEFFEQSVLDQLGAEGFSWRPEEEREKGESEPLRDRLALIEDRSIVLRKGGKEKLRVWSRTLPNAIEEALRRVLQEGRSDEADACLRTMLERNRYAAFWGVALRLLASHPKELAPSLAVPLLSDRGLLGSFSTAGDAADALRAVFPLLGEGERDRIEEAVASMADDDSGEDAGWRRAVRGALAAAIAACRIEGRPRREELLWRGWRAREKPFPEPPGIPEPVGPARTIGAREATRESGALSLVRLVGRLADFAHRCSTSRSGDPGAELREVLDDLRRVHAERERLTLSGRQALSSAVSSALRNVDLASDAEALAAIRAVLFDWASTEENSEGALAFRMDAASGLPLLMRNQKKAAGNVDRDAYAAFRLLLEDPEPAVRERAVIYGSCE
jgi:hypothetical protein